VATAGAFDIEAELSNPGIVEFPPHAPRVSVRGPLSANDIEKLLAPSFNAQIEKLLAHALSDKEDKEIRNAMGKPATPEDAAKELYHAMLTVGRAVAELAMKKPEALKGIGRGHLDTVVYYDGRSGDKDVVEPWIKLVGLGEDFRLSGRKMSKSANLILTTVVSEAFHDLHLWRSLRKFDGGKAPKEFACADEVRAALNVEVRQDDGGQESTVEICLKRPPLRCDRCRDDCGLGAAQMPTIEFCGDALDESSFSLEERKAYAPELALRMAAKRLPDPRSYGRASEIWAAALIGWMELNFGGESWPEAEAFGGIANGKARSNDLKKQVIDKLFTLLK
jgi:hypothetical protein